MLSIGLFVMGSHAVTEWLLGFHIELIHPSGLVARFPRTLRYGSV